MPSRGRDSLPLGVLLGLGALMLAGGQYPDAPKSDPGGEATAPIVDSDWDYQRTRDADLVCMGSEDEKACVREVAAERRKAALNAPPRKQRRPR